MEEIMIINNMVFDGEYTNTSIHLRGQIIDGSLHDCKVIMYANSAIEGSEIIDCSIRILPVVDEEDVPVLLDCNITDSCINGSKLAMGDCKAREIFGECEQVIIIN